MAKFEVQKREPLSKPAYIRLREDTWERIKRLSENTKVGKSEVVQQCIDFALENMD